ncbi:MAG: 5-formyltetrahydrofolate cyclo-ligase [Eubacteriaceae bacterium]|jgi:5-formyltetrahydrofolate cyclo-ligase|nr:5-formyltetrahydrofolate cyclo-ligase [Eubacteriaceae bacterium]MDD4507549.1 5-formyltetrahydrofolate cyclo-ligase [Eubacteriaceae bacterium]
MNKKELRKTILEKRKASADAARDRAIVGNLMASAMYRNARCIMTTISFGDEIDTHGLIERALGGAKTIAVPRCDPSTHTLSVHGIRQFPDDLIPGHYGIPEPGPDTPLLDLHTIDLVIVPGMAFNLEGHRLGYGGGYYDRFLTGLSGRTITVALTPESLILPKLPVETHDQPVHYLVTEKRIIRTHCTGVSH